MKKSTHRIVGLSVVLCLMTLSSFGQVMDFHYKQIPLHALIDTISVHTNIKVSYDANAVPVDSLIDVDAKAMHPTEILKEILENQPLQITLNDNQIVISSQPFSTTINYIRLRGKVYSIPDSLPLSMVNIAIEGKAIGTITNMEGDFEFLLPENYQYDTVSFSCIGYRSKKVVVNSFDSLMQIKMHRYDVQLKEVEVKYENVDHIIDLVIKNKDDNYYNKQAVLTGFFRESISQDGDFVQVSEAIIEILKPSYQKLSALERVRFIKGRKLAGLPAMDMVNFKLEGGPYQFSRIDIARYLDFMPKKNGEVEYKFAYDGVDYLDGEMVFRIKFSPIEDDGELKYQGELYVHSNTYALVHVDFKLTRKSLKNSRKSLIRKESAKVRTKLKLAQYFIDYRRYGGKWILNKIGGEIVIHINDRKRDINSEFTGKSELLINDCEFRDDEKFKSTDLYKPNYVLADEIKESDDEFWENYNIIKPDEEIENVFKNAEIKLDAKEK